MKKLKLSKEIHASYGDSFKTIVEHHYTIDRLTKDLKHFEGRLDQEPEGTAKLIESQVRKLVEVAKEFLGICRRDSTVALTSCQPQPLKRPQ